MLLDVRVFPHMEVSLGVHFAHGVLESVVSQRVACMFQPHSLTHISMKIGTHKKNCVYSKVRTVLCCAALCCGVLCCAVLCCAVLPFAALRCAVLLGLAGLGCSL